MKEPLKFPGPFPLQGSKPKALSSGSVRPGIQGQFSVLSTGNNNSYSIPRPPACSLEHSEMVPGEGNGNPLQYSCLENPRDGGAWWAAVYGVAQNWTQLRRLSSSRDGSSEVRPSENWENSIQIVFTVAQMRNLAESHPGGWAAVSSGVSLLGWSPVWPCHSPARRPWASNLASPSLRFHIWEWIWQGLPHGVAVKAKEPSVRLSSWASPSPGEAGPLSWLENQGSTRSSKPFVAYPAGAASPAPAAPGTPTYIPCEGSSDWPCPGGGRCYGAFLCAFLGTVRCLLWDGPAASRQLGSLSVCLGPCPSVPGSSPKDSWPPASRIWGCAQPVPWGPEWQQEAVTRPFLSSSLAWGQSSASRVRQSWNQMPVVLLAGCVPPGQVL